MKCLNEFQVKKKSGDYVRVRCRHCLACKADYENQLREICKSVARNAENSVFLTMTIAPQHMEYAEVTDKETGEIFKVETIVKKHLQDFNRRIKYNDNKHRKEYPIRSRENKEWQPLFYIQTGEYGKGTMRPHYHSVYWNLHPRTIKNIEKYWTKGIITAEKVKGGAVGYIIQHQLKAKREGQIFYEGQQEPFMSRSVNMDRYLSEDEQVGNYIEARHNKVNQKFAHHHEYPKKVKDKVIEKRKLPEMTTHQMLKAQRLKEQEDEKFFEENFMTRGQRDNRILEEKERFRNWKDVGNRKKRL